MKDAEGLGWHAGGLGAGDLVRGTWSGSSGLPALVDVQACGAAGADAAGAGAAGRMPPAIFTGRQNSGVGNIQVGIAR